MSLTIQSQLTCCICKENKSTSEFPKSKNRPTGFSGKCKVCNTHATYAWQEKNKERYGYRIARNHSKIRGHPFTLTFEAYTKIVENPCYYCEEKLWSKPGQYGSSLDRIDNSVGYVEGNILPCCWNCNCARNAVYTVDEWKVGIKAIQEFRRTK